MNKLQSIAISIIAIVLAVQFYLSQVHPKIILYQKEDRYLVLATECHQAVSERDQLQRRHSKLPAKIFTALKQASDVAMMGCYQKDELRLDLLTDGVSPRELDLIELRAKAVSVSSLSHFVKGLGASQ